MGHTTTRNYGFHWVDSKAKTGETKQETGEETRQKTGASWLHRVAAAIVARLEADTPPLATAMAYSHAYRAAPLPYRYQ